MQFDMFVEQNFFLRRLYFFIQIPCIIWDPRICHCAHKNPLLVPDLSQINLVFSFPPLFLSDPLQYCSICTRAVTAASYPISFRPVTVSLHLHQCCYSCLFCSFFFVKTLYVFIFHMHARCPSHLYLDLIAQIVVRIAIYEAPQYGIFSCLLLLSPSQAQMCSSTCYS